MGTTITCDCLEVEKDRVIHYNGICKVATETGYDPSYGGYSNSLGEAQKAGDEPQKLKKSDYDGDPIYNSGECNDSPVTISHI